MNGQGTTEQLGALQTRGLIFGVAGLAVLAGAYFTDAEQFFHSYLTAFLYWIAISLGCLGWAMIYNLTYGRWGTPARRVWEAGARTIFVMILLFLPIVLGMETLFPWARPEAVNDPITSQKLHYLNTPFFIGRAVFFFGLWSFFAFMLSKWSRQQDEEGFEPTGSKMRKLSGIGLLLMALTVTFYSVDWAMSLDPHWFSTIFGFLFAVSNLLAAIAFTILVVRMLHHSSESYEKTVTIETYHDLGNLMMAFTMLWAYISFSQFLIIWSGNTQEEAPWYLERMGEGWIMISLALIVFHFALPFLVLLTRKSKRAPQMLARIAVWMLIMRFVDLYWLTQPSMSHGELHPSPMDLIAVLAMGGVWLGFFAMQLKERPLIATHDPRLAEILETAGGHH